MRSAAMLTYPGVARALGFTEAPPRSAQAEAMKKGLRCVDELSRKLRRIRMRRGALDLDLPEAKIELDAETGAPIDIIKRAEDPGIKRAYQMVEELMLLANELVAQWLSSRRCPAVYRVHGKPDEEKLARLGEVAHTLGVKVDLDELLEPNGVSRWLKHIEQHPKKNVLEMLLLRSLKQAQYDIVNIGHFGLASDAYLHFTSPIRRYPDLLVHRMVKHLLRGGKPDTRTAAIEDLRMAATEASTRERAVMNVEREVVDLYRALYMRGHLGETFEGNVTAVVGSGLFVALDHPFVDVLVRYEALGPEHFQATDDELSAVGLISGERISLGDRILIEIEDVAILRRVTFGRRVVAAAPRAERGRRRREEPKQRQRSERSERSRPSRERGSPRPAKKGRGKPGRRRK